METEQLSGISALHQQKENIRDWQASKEELKKMRKTKCANRGPNANWPKLEDDVLKWIQGHRQNDIGINKKNDSNACL
jgi:hypothetical protein